MPGENPHDTFFKALLGDKSNAISFFQSYLPENLQKHIDFNTLTLSKESFLDEKLKQTFSDLLYQTKEQSTQLYVLFEHKSRPEKYTALQLLKYMTKIWFRDIEQNKPTNLPLVLPIVVYHGKEKWKWGNELKVLFSNNPNLSQYIPNFSYLLYDLSQYTDSEIKGNTILQVGLQLLKNIRSPQLPHKLHQILNALAHLYDEQKALQWVHTCLKYLSMSNPQITLDKLQKIGENLEIKGVESTMPTIAETLRKEGYLQAQEHGKYLAELREKRADRKRSLRTAILLLNEGSEFAFIQKVTELNATYLTRFLHKIGRLAK
ncbi:MAG: Rpn family recombination-promoting nuclease/putative transposase [Spirochaetota bacterium]